MITLKQALVMLLFIAGLTAVFTVAVMYLFVPSAGKAEVQSASGQKASAPVAVGGPVSLEDDMLNTKGAIDNIFSGEKISTETRMRYVEAHRDTPVTEVVAAQP